MTRLSPAGEAINECPATTDGYTTDVGRRNQQGAAVVALCIEALDEAYADNTISHHLRMNLMGRLEALTVVPPDVISDDRIGSMWLATLNNQPTATVEREELQLVLRELRRRREADR